MANAIPSIKALKGQSVAVTFSTLGPYVLSRALGQQGLALTDVQLRNIHLAKMPAALRSGEVKAAVFSPPTATTPRAMGPRAPCSIAVPLRARCSTCWRGTPLFCAAMATR